MRKADRRRLQHAAAIELARREEYQRVHDLLTAGGRTLEEGLAELTTAALASLCPWEADLFRSISGLEADLIALSNTSQQPEPVAPPLESPPADWAAVRKMLDKAVADRNLKAIYAARVAAQILLHLERVEA